MRRRKDDCTSPSSSSPAGSGHPSDPTGPSPPNAFAPELFEALEEREPEPVVPGAELPGPWRVTRLWGDGPPLWAVYGLGERGPRLTFCEAGGADLAYLAAAALAVAERPRRFRFQRGADDRLHLMHDGAGVACIHTPALEHTSLAATPAEVLRRAGAIFMDELQKAR